MEEVEEDGHDDTNRTRSHGSRLDEVPSDLLPHGCSLRKFSPPGKNPFWLGQLPRGLVGDNGKKSLSKGWGGFRTSAETEDEACTEVMEWLWRSCGQRTP